MGRDGGSRPSRERVDGTRHPKGPGGGRVKKRGEGGGAHLMVQQSPIRASWWSRLVRGHDHPEAFPSSQR